MYPLVLVLSATALILGACGGEPTKSTDGRYPEYHYRWFLG